MNLSKMIASRDASFVSTKEQIFKAISPFINEVDSASVLHLDVKRRMSSSVFWDVHKHTLYITIKNVDGTQKVLESHVSDDVNSALPNFHNWMHAWNKMFDLLDKKNVKTFQNQRLRMCDLHDKFYTSDCEICIKQKLKRETERKKNLDKQTYVIGHEDGDVVKIGIAKNVNNRLKQLSTGNEKKLKILYTVHGDCEKELHQVFANKRVAGEWFSVNVEQVKKAIKKIDR